MGWLSDRRKARSADEMVIKARRRADLLSSSQLMEWVEISFSEVYRGIDGWKQIEDTERRFDAISDAATALEITLVLVEVLRERQRERVEKGNRGSGIT